MSAWKVRPAGSPQHVVVDSAQEVVDGVMDGMFEPDDEVAAMHEERWQPIERHPQFEDVMHDYEPPPPRLHPDETRLDMNPLIDVSLVLLIFFILTTTYQQLVKEFPPPDAVEQDERVKQAMTAEQIHSLAIGITARMEDGKVVYRVEDEVVPAEGMQKKIEEWRDKRGVTKVAMDVAKDVPWGALIAIQDAAAGANISETIQIMRPRKED